MTAQSGLGFSGIVAIQIPDNGATGEVLTKLSNDDYDYDWQPGGGGGGGQVNTVVGGTNINVDATDPVNPIVNLDAAITGVSVNGVTLTAAGGGTLYLTDDGTYQAVPAGVFGTQFNYAESLAISTTTSTTFQNKVTLNLVGLPAGLYRVGVQYGWNHDSIANDFEARFQLDAVNVGQIHKQEPKDAAGNDPDGTGTTQRYLAHRLHYLNLNGNHTLTLDYRTDTNNVESSIWDATIEVWRIS